MDVYYKWFIKDFWKKYLSIVDLKIICKLFTKIVDWLWPAINHEGFVDKLCVEHLSPNYSSIIVQILDE